MGFLIPPLVILAFGMLMASLSGFSTSQVQPRPGSSGKIAPFYTGPVQYWGGSIEAWSEEYSLDPNLVATVMQIESCGDPGVASSAGAAGLFQVMPFHFTAGEIATDPGTNARRGLGYLSKSLAAADGDIYLALAGYNGGIGVISRSRNTWAAETLRYAAWGSAIYADAAAGRSESPALQDWLAHGGSGLCERAARNLDIR